MNRFRLGFSLLLAVAAASCSDSGKAPGSPGAPGTQPGGGSCVLVNSGFGPSGTTPVRFEPVVTGLEVPWGVGILPGGTDWLVTERPGRVRLIRNGSLVAAPVATVAAGETNEGGLLGIAIDPAFASNSYFYVFYTTPDNLNQVQRYVLSSDHATATADRVLIDGIPAGVNHDGGRLKFGPDGNLYIGTGDAIQNQLSRDPTKPNGKILRIDRDGGIPGDNPEPGQPWFIKGVRNVEAFDFLDADTIILADNGPTGEYNGETGGDEVDIAHKGDDLGWPTTWHCEQQAGLVTPILSWITAVPPGGGLLYTGNDIPDWKGNFIIGTMGSEHVHRVVLDSSRSEVTHHEVYFQGEPPTGLGRVRDVFQGLAGELYVTTTNCDGRGSCPATQDGIYRIHL